ncbi:MAG: hypothetical protein JWQ49_4334 [Edaphobacter sp.]|nr:hypothetical protein [Edaphobacter sp.]
MHARANDRSTPQPLWSPNDSLVEIVAVQRSLRTGLLLHDMDTLLQHRPDWVIYRLCRLRDNRTSFILPDAVGGVDLLKRQLKQVANDPNEDQKWTALGIVAQFVLRLTQGSKIHRCVRVSASPAPQGEEIAEGDRVDDESLRFIVGWVEQRVKKLAAQTACNTGFPLRQNRKRRFSRDDLIATEKLLILGLAKLSIMFARLDLAGPALVDSEHQQAIVVSSCLSEVRSLWDAANGGWIPRSTLFARRLAHTGRRLRSETVASCFLPFNSHDYNEWIGAACGHVAACTEGILPAATRFAWCMSGIKHREEAFWSASERELRLRSDPLVAALSSGFYLAVELGRLDNAAGLAARFLHVASRVGWTGALRRRVGDAQMMKATARVMGCALHPAAEQLDFSAVYDDTIPDIKELLRDALALRQDDLTENARTARDAARIGKATPEAQQDINNITSALEVRNERGHSHAKHRWMCLWLIHKALSGKESSEYLDRLLNVHASVFRVSRDSGVPGNIALLIDVVREHKPDILPFFYQASVVIDFAQSLLTSLQRPNMEDAARRRGWQHTLWKLYIDLPENVRNSLTLDQTLLVYGAVSHMTAGTLRALRQPYADQLELSPAEEEEEIDELEMPIDAMSAATSVNLDSTALRELFDSFFARGQLDTALVQIVISPDGQTATVHVSRRVRDTLVHTEADVRFEPSEYEAISYASWLDVRQESDRHPYFSELSGELNDYAMSPLGHPSVRLLWNTITSSASRLAGGRMPTHFCIAPDGTVANLPWQLIAVCESDVQERCPLVTLIHGLRWVYLTAHHSRAGGESKRHTRGIQAWIASEPTPDATRDLRGQISIAFMGATSKECVLTEQLGLSLSVVFGHGKIEPNEIHAKSAAVPAEDWDKVRQSRICVLLSCENGSGKQGGLGDVSGLTHYLCRHAKVVLAPSNSIPSSSATVLAGCFNHALTESLAGLSRSVHDVYREAISKNRAVALFSLWGLAYERLILKSLSSRLA